jgi:glutaredoxin 3
MKQITVYSTQVCPYCNQAKALLTSLQVPFKNVDLSADPDLWENLSVKYNWHTVPMIVIGEEFIGGFSDLKKLQDKGELLKKIAG